MSTFTITSDHPDAARILRTAIENYAFYAASHARMKRTRHLHPGETREQLAKEADVLDARSAAAETMAQQVTGGQAGPTTTTRKRS